ncbi:MAG TPA: oligoendopeptidase F [Candidatus Avoscillospira stercoripullorum]|uniref:Oligopeptidase F n=1 Tax=Candidatus Avoscillospira stercoripullorum TaxID=2840709 RepID=A0A9D1A922_9FIRM|nr:oligoendopeptidase F [Candidatus Avoscillospira stercoripullorum]
MQQKEIPLRSQQLKENCWAVEDIYPTEEAWSQALSESASLPEELAAYQGKLGESAETLLSYLTRMEEISHQADRLFVYAMLRADEDTANSTHQAMKGKCFSFLVSLSSATAFEGPELVAIPDETLDAFYAQEPGLTKYRRYLTKARLEKPHILSQAEEKLLAGAAEVGAAPSNIFNTLNNADMTFPAVTDSEGVTYPLTNGSYISLMERSDRTLRENAFRSFYGVYESYANTLAASYNAEVRKNLFFAKARKYDSALAAAMEPVEVPEAVYHSLVDTVRKNLDKMHRYMGLRKKAMGLSELHMYDIYANMIPEAEEVVPFAQARDEVIDAMGILGEEYQSVLKSGFEARWMDIYENKGKRSGAYSCGCAGIHPFVLLNHKETLDSEFTLAHELGHAMHSYLSDKHQPSIYNEYVLFVAEVASTCNEALLMQYLLARTEDPKKRAVLINYFLEQFRTTLYRQTMFAEFELKAHEMAAAGETLTADNLKAMYLQLNKDYYGEETVVDEEIAIEWARIPHFYRNFYVYQYATGFSAAIAISQKIQKEGAPAVENYLKFLSGGCSTDPVSLLKIAGVDMSTPAPVESALELFGRLIDELDALLTK